MRAIFYFIVGVAVAFAVAELAWGYDPIRIPATEYEIGWEYLSCPNGPVVFREYNLSGSEDYIEVRAFFHVRQREPQEIPFLIFEYPATETSVGPRRIDLILPYSAPQPVTLEYLEKTFPSVCDIPRLPN